MTSSSGKIKSHTIIVIIITIAIAVAAAIVVRMNIVDKSSSGLNKQFEYDLSDRRKIDPALYLCREIPGVITVPIADSRALAVDKGNNIYVIGDKELALLDPDGSLKTKITLDRSGTCVAVGENGTIYAGLTNKIALYDKTGVWREQWDCPQENALLSSITVNEQGVFAADSANRKVLRFEHDGRYILDIVADDPEGKIAGFIVPSPYLDLATAPDGLLRVNNPGYHKIITFTLGGEMKSSWGKYAFGVEGFCGCCNPINLAILPNGDIVTCEKGLTRVKIYDNEGKFLGVVAGPEQFVGHDKKNNEKNPNSNIGVLDVAVNAEGNIYVLDPVTGQIRKFARER